MMILWLKVVHLKVIPAAAILGNNGHLWTRQIILLQPDFVISGLISVAHQFAQIITNVRLKSYIFINAEIVITFNVDYEIKVTKFKHGYGSDT